MEKIIQSSQHEHVEKKSNKSNDRNRLGYDLFLCRNFPKRQSRNHCQRTRKSNDTVRCRFHRKRTSDRWSSRSSSTDEPVEHGFRCQTFDWSTFRRSDRPERYSTMAVPSCFWTRQQTVDRSSFQKRDKGFVFRSTLRKSEFNSFFFLFQAIHSRRNFIDGSNENERNRWKFSRNDGSRCRRHRSGLFQRFTATSRASRDQQTSNRVSSSFLGDKGRRNDRRFECCSNYQWTNGSCTRLRSWEATSARTERFDLRSRRRNVRCVDFDHCQRWKRRFDFRSSRDRLIRENSKRSTFPFLLRENSFVDFSFQPAILISAVKISIIEWSNILPKSFVENTAKTFRKIPKRCVDWKLVANERNELYRRRVVPRSKSIHCSKESISTLK